MALAEIPRPFPLASPGHEGFVGFFFFVMRMDVAQMPNPEALRKPEMRSHPWGEGPWLVPPQDAVTMVG